MRLFQRFYSAALDATKSRRALHVLISLLVKATRFSVTRSELIHVENTGAFLGIGATLPESVRVVVFQGGICMVILGLLWAAAFRRETRPWQVTGFALLAASGIGNLIDRFVFDGRVTDFLNVGIGSLRTGIFNIADVVGMVGFAILIFANGGTAPSNRSLERTRAE